jgi:uncharacterized protein YdbL (DUF1318 family)
VGKFKILFFSVLATALVSCVTINVYFPSAEAERAAEAFVEEVLGEERNDEGALLDPLNLPGNVIYLAAVGVLDFVVPSAAAQQPDFKINTPQVNAIKQRMAERQRTHLNSWFDAGAIGFTADGLISVRDRAAVGLDQRRLLERVVAEENRDRNAVYREIAVANGHPEWESDVRETWSREWVRNARPGWYFQRPDGAWQKK